MLICGKLLNICINTDINNPSSSWWTIRRHHEETDGYIQFTLLSALLPGDVLACGTACMEICGVVESVTKNDNVYTIALLPIPSTPHRWKNIIQLGVVLGSEAIDLYWNTDRSGWFRSGSVSDNIRGYIFGQCATNAWPGGDVSITSGETLIIGRSGRAASFENYLRLKFEKGNGNPL